jgi:WD40 repeat protein
VQALDWSGAKPEAAFAASKEAILSFALSPDGAWAAGGGEGGGIYVWNAVTRELVKIYTGHAGPVRSVAFRADGRALVSGSADMTALVWDLGALVK